jgi:hypothetical protein
MKLMRFVKHGFGLLVEAQTTSAHIRLLDVDHVIVPVMQQEMAFADGNAIVLDPMEIGVF